MKQSLISVLLVAAVFTVGMILNKGDRRNIYSIVAAIGCIPAAMAAVSMVLMWMQKPVDASEQIFQQPPVPVSGAVEIVAERRLVPGRIRQKDGCRPCQFSLYHNQC